MARERRRTVRKMLTFTEAQASTLQAEADELELDLVSYLRMLIAIGRKSSSPGREMVEAAVGKVASQPRQ